MSYVNTFSSLLLSLLRKYKNSNSRQKNFYICFCRISVYLVYILVNTKFLPFFLHKFIHILNRYISMVRTTFPHYPQISYELHTDKCAKLTTIYRKCTLYPQLINKLWTILGIFLLFIIKKVIDI